MPAKYPDVVIEAIWVLACDGKKPAEITRLLVAGNAVEGLDPFQANYYTVQERLIKLRRERGEPENHVAEGTESNVASRLRRKALERARIEIDKLDKKDELSAGDANLLIKWAKFVDDVEARLADRSRIRDEGKAAAGAKGGHRAPPRSILGKIAEQERERERNGTTSGAGWPD